MGVLSIVLERGAGPYRPGEPLRGTAGWKLAQRPSELVLRLFWYTAGKGTVDVGVVEEREFPDAGTEGQERFEFALPRGPYAFRGRLVSLLWAVELVVERGEEAERAEFALTPGEGPVELGKVDPGGKGAQRRVGA